MYKTSFVIHFRYFCFMKKLLSFILLLFGMTAHSQQLKVEYDKNHDFSQYKTFRIGEGEVTTPKDQRQINEAQLKKWVTSAVVTELKLRGLQQADSTADLVVSYIVGSMAKSDAGDVGPMGLTPGSMDRTYMRDYRQGNLVIDLNDRRNNLVWRINGTTEMSNGNAEGMINAIVQKGFKNYGKPVKSKKKKK
jgi:hypothetical protein